MVETDLSQFILDFLVALGVGALIGLEREHRRDQTQVIAGVRTFPLFSLSGYMLALVARTLGSGESLIVAAGIASIAAIAIAFLVVRHQLGVTGLTTPMAMIVTFFLGLLIGFGFVQQAIVVGVATTFLLLTKERLHTFAEILDDQEIMGALQFITVVFILYPLVANLSPPVAGQEWIGRGALVDPYFTLLIVIFVSSISFASFIAMRTVGARRGVAVSGLLGGLVSSEATTVSLAEHAKESSALVRPAVMGALLATTTMFVRNLAIAAFADPSLDVFTLMLPVLVPMALVGAAVAWGRYREQAGHEAERGAAVVPRVANPFALGPAIKFALLFLGLSVAAELAQQFLGPAGVYATALGGFVSAGAVVASVAALHATRAVDTDVAAVTAILATAIGALNKILILRTVNHAVYERARGAFITLTVIGVVGVVAVAVGLL